MPVLRCNVTARAAGAAHVSWRIALACALGMHVPVSTTATYGQVVLGSEADPARAALAIAEAGGRAHPRAERVKRLPPSWNATEWWGAADRRCIEAHGAGPVRSGDFIIGGELGRERPIYPRASAKIWWAPFHNAADMDSLVISGTRLSAPMEVRLAFGQVAYTSAPNSRTPLPDREYFFPTGTVIPDWGRWLLVATSGANWGCFIVVLGRG